MAFSWKNVPLLLLLFLLLEQTSASPPRRMTSKPGLCPKDRLTCKTKVLGSCKTDFHCKEFLKCCYFACKKKCLDPFQEPCTLPPEPGPCHNKRWHWYFDYEHQECKLFLYGGCLGNANNFPTNADCQKACKNTVKIGLCPLFPSGSRMECPPLCMNDVDCPDREKCCETTCGPICAKAWSGKLGFCPQRPKECGQISEPMCLQDDDCPLHQKCCLYCGLRCLEPKI
ncbi:WAP four-disulfide core domain protein 8 [Ochotona princeps]|uniref:WAP four-disulfide core domain protein 8 n=1 Tax=Ochotona princeps TaxID=9978 RepID=UPI00032B0074|nr:WAP four-disulfide core domain protein 8 [Ochotona princeps]